jgi:hypothetical protein
MAIYDLFSAAISFIIGRQPSLSPDNTDSEYSTAQESPENYLIRESRLAAKKSIPYDCDAACSEVDTLIAKVISIDVENQTSFTDLDDILPSIEDPDGPHPPDLLFKREASVASADIWLYNSPKPSRVTKINGLDIEGKYITQVGQARYLCAQGWNIESILVYLKLARRGYEPLFSTAWKLDFPKFPSTLFTHDDNSVFIKSRSSYPLTHGIRDFDKFCEMGKDIRSAERRKAEGRETPGKITTVANQAMQKYIKAVWMDAKLWDAIVEGRLPELLVVVTGDADSTIDELSELAKQKLHKRANQMLSFLAPSNECAIRDDSDSDSGFKNPQRLPPEMPQLIISPPIILGIVAYDTVVGVIACEPLSPGMQIRNLGFYHFNRQHEEVWNCISLAILIHWARNSMIRAGDALGISLERTREIDDPDL